MSSGQIGKFTNVKFDTSADALTDISDYVQEFSGPFPGEYDQLEESGFTEDHSTIFGQGNSNITMKVLYNATTHAMFTHPTTGLNATRFTARNLQLEYGINAAPTSGDLTINGSYRGFANIETAKDGILMIAVSLSLAGGSMPTLGTL